jgi:outer membrane biosynthesis protein TonB
MRRQLFHLWLAASASGCLIIGCQHSARRAEYPAEPLLLSKPPVEGKIEVVDSAPPPHSEPMPPPLPAETFVALPRPLPVGPVTPLATPTPEPPRQEAPAPARTTNAEPPPVPANPAARPKGPVSAFPASRIRETPAPKPPEGPELASPSPLEAFGTTGTYGHNPGYTWLQGTLDRHYRGHIYLRYCDPTMDDRWGGKVRLEHDPRLADFKDGDVVSVEGTMANAPDNRDHWQQYPDFRIKAARLVQRKN